MIVLKLPNISLDELTVIEENRVTYNLNEPVEILPNESRIPVVQEDHKAIILQCRATIFRDSKYLTYFMNASTPARPIQHLVKNELDHWVLIH